MGTHETPRASTGTFPNPPFGPVDADDPTAWVVDMLHVVLDSAEAVHEVRSGPAQENWVDRDSQIAFTDYTGDIYRIWIDKGTV